MKSIVRLTLFALCAVLLVTGGILIGRGLSNIEGPKGQLVETTEEVAVATATAMPTMVPTATDEPTMAPTVELTATAEPTATATMVPTEAPTATAEPMATATFEATEEVAEEVVEGIKAEEVEEIEAEEIEAEDIDNKKEMAIVAFPNFVDGTEQAHLFFYNRETPVTKEVEGIGDPIPHQGSEGRMGGKVEHSFIKRSFKDAYSVREIAYVIFEEYNDDRLDIYEIIEGITVLNDDEDALAIGVEPCLEKPVVARLFLDKDDETHYWDIIRRSDGHLVVGIHTKKDVCEKPTDEVPVSGGGSGGTTVSTETPTEEPTQEPEVTVTPDPQYDPVVLPEETGEPDPQYDKVNLPEFQEEETDYVPDNPEILGWDYQTEVVPEQQYDEVNLSPVVEGEVPQENIGDTTEVLAWGDEPATTENLGVGAGYVPGYNYGYYGGGYDYSNSYDYGYGYDYSYGYNYSYDSYDYSYGYDYGSNSYDYGGSSSYAPAPSYDSDVVLPWG